MKSKNLYGSPFQMVFMVPIFMKIFELKPLLIFSRTSIFSKDKDSSLGFEFGKQNSFCNITLFGAP